MISIKNSVHEEMVGDTAGGRLLRLNNVEWRRGEKLRMQMIQAPMSLDSMVQYLSMDVKLNSKKGAHIRDRHRHANRDRWKHQIIAKTRKHQPPAKIEVKVQGLRMETRRPTGST